MSSKSSVKLLIPEKENNPEAKLFGLVALLTGFKNALKGVGFFLGGFLLSLLGYTAALQCLASLLIVILILSLLFVRKEFGKTKSKPTFSQLFSKSQAINRLSFARAFLFASRDVWFVVGLPIFLHEELSWSFSTVGGFMAVWVIGYGFIQALAPKIARATSGLPSTVQAARHWGVALVVISAFIPLFLSFNFYPGMTLLICLSLFGFIFAMNSSIHSYLILAYTTGDDVTLNVGFYYMANAVGRLSGTFLSGLMYYTGGLHACLWTAAVMCGASAIISRTFPSKIDSN